MNKIYFAIAIHFHQPTGNFENIFQRAHDLCYAPFIKLLSEYPNIKMAFHFSGCLLDYIHEKHPETIALIKTMVKKHQIEMLGGAYYEPILTAIPTNDVIGQIKMMSEHIREHFGSLPSGMWIAERVWEPYLAQIIYEAGIKYSILDDVHLQRSGVQSENMHGYFLTGQGEKKIAIFPSDKTLRYNIPFKLPHETMDYFKGVLSAKGNVLFTYGDDGEKFGEWPGTHDWVYKEQWLKKFFDALTENQNWIETIHFKDYFKSKKPTAELDIKSGSYQEMMEWSGGSWNNFMLKYPETNQMHKKMLYISDRIKQLEGRVSVKDKTKLQQARRELYRAQCNCGYWHGVFGGLYLYHLRNAIYTHLIKAESIIDCLLYKGKKSWTNVSVLDFAKLDNNDLVLDNKAFSICIDTQDGGTITELDYKPLYFNLTNALSRKKEDYHQKIIESINKEDSHGVSTIHDDFRTVTREIKSEIVYDKFPRRSLREYFLPGDTTQEKFALSDYTLLNEDISKPRIVKKTSDEIVLEKKIKVLQSELTVLKTIRIVSEENINFCYVLTKKDKATLKDAIFGFEFNLTAPCADLDKAFEKYAYVVQTKKIAPINGHGVIAGVASFAINDSDKEFNMVFKLGKKADNIWFFPVKTVSQSERAYELNYQCSCLFFSWKPVFDKNQTMKITVDLNFPHKEEKCKRKPEKKKSKK